MENYYEQLLERSNNVINFIERQLKPMNDERLTWKEHPKKWSLIETVDHLNKVYDVYLDNFEKAVLAATPLGSQVPKLRHTILGRLSIYSMKPKGRKRKFKMKTFDFFEPDDGKGANKILETFFANKEKFNELMREARLRDLTNIKIPTALGEKMKFYVPECFDFIMSHEERHIVQMEDILAKSTNLEQAI